MPRAWHRRRRRGASPGRWLANASVIVVGTNPVVGTTTDASGRYSLSNVPAGARQLQARLIGFAPLTLPVAGIDVGVPGGAAAAVVLGNSIADGRGSGTDRQNQWPDNLARRLHDGARTREVAVINSGIGGNCVLKECIGPSGLARLDRDVLQHPGVRWLVVSEGVNDIGGARGDSASSAVADSLVAAYRRIVDAAHRKGVRAYGATILPFAGSPYDSPAHEQARQRVNAWIRTSRAFDAVIDLDAAMRDPTQPARLRADVDGGDHLHPNELGYRVMADAIDLDLFTR